MQGEDLAQGQAVGQVTELGWTTRLALGLVRGLEKAAKLNILHCTGMLDALVLLGALGFRPCNPGYCSVGLLRALVAHLNQPRNLGTALIELPQQHQPQYPDRKFADPVVDEPESDPTL